MHPETWEKQMEDFVHQSMDGRFINVEVGEERLTCEVASSLGSRVAGLADRAELPQDGMIFMYQGDHTAPFTLEGMLIEVAVTFFDNEGEPILSSTEENVVQAESPYRYVLETAADRDLDGRLVISGAVPD